MNEIKTPTYPKVLLVVLLVIPLLGLAIAYLKDALLTSVQTAPSITPESPLLVLGFMVMIYLPFLLVSGGLLLIGSMKMRKQDTVAASRLLKDSAIFSVIGIVLVLAVGFTF